MYDPVLNRPMFQAQPTDTPMSAAPSMGAKGTGITSMVTSPETTAQQLKAFANPAVPTVGYAEGGPVQHFQQGGPASANPLVSTMWDKFIGSITTKNPTMATGKYHLPDVGLRIGQSNDYRQEAGITGGAPNYVEPINVGGPDATMSQDQRNALYMRTSAERQNQDPRIQLNLEYDRRVREEQQRNREAGIPAIDRATTAVREGFGPKTDAESSEMQQDQRIRDRIAQAAEEEARQKSAVQKVLAARGQAGDIGDMQNALPDVPTRTVEPPPPSVIQTDTVVNPGAGGGAPKGDIATQLAQIKAERNAQSAADRRENALMALMSAGFGMAAGKSRHALTNIAEGGQQGIASFAALERARREDENRRYMAALHEREMLAKEPYMQAQTEQARAQAAYYRARPGMEQARLEQAKAQALTKAQLAAEKDVYAHIDKNPAAFMGANGKPDQMKIDAEIQKRKNNIYPSILYDTVNGGRQTDGSSGE